MQDLFPSSTFLYSIRNSENILQVLKQRTNYLKCSFGYSGAVLWNGLSSKLRKPLTLTSYRKGINDFYASMGTHNGKHVKQYYRFFLYHFFTDPFNRGLMEFYSIQFYSIIFYSMSAQPTKQIPDTNRWWLFT